MHGRDPAGEIAHLHAREPGLFDHRRKGLLRRKSANAFGKITVGLAIIRNPFAELRQHRKGITFIERIKPGRFHVREFETEEPPARLQHTPRLGERLFDMRHVADTESDRVGVHGLIGDRQFLGIATDPGDGALAHLLRTAHALIQHGSVDIADRDLRFAAARPRKLGDAEGDVARAAGNIEDRLPRLRIEPFDHGVFPQPMDAARHQIVHRVVARGDRGKDLAHECFFFLFRYVAEAETGGGIGRHGHGWETSLPVAPSPWSSYRSPSRYPAGPTSTKAANFMPELPEVETVKMGLVPVLEGHRFTHVETRRRDLRRPFPPRFAERLTGRKVERLARRAKYLLAELEGGETLVIHLGMSGRMSVYAEGKSRKLGQYVYDAAPADAGHGKHDHVVMETDAPARIVFTDHRRFGLMTLIPTNKIDSNPLFKGLGVEPL